MADAIVGPLLSKLQEVALKEGKALAGVGDEIDRLRERLMWMHALVHETDLRNRSEGNQLVRVFSRQMREIAFEAEDAVDHFFLEVDLSRFGRDWRRAARLFFANFGTQIYIRHILSRKIKSMNVRLEDIHDNNAKYSSNNGNTAATTWRAARYIPPVRHNWDDSDLEKSNKQANPTNGSPAVKETQTEQEKGNRSATKRTCQRNDTGIEEAKPKKTTTKSRKTSAELKQQANSEEEKQQAKSEEEKQQDKLEEKKRQEAKLERKKNKANLKELLLDEKEAGTGSFVIYVVGESGMGKRYLIRKAYEDATITGKFDVRIWPSFPPPPDTSYIADQTKRMLTDKCSKLQPREKKLYQAKYLVVLDCPMSSAMLGSIIEQFPQGAPGSKIVVAATTSPPEEIGGIIKLGYLDKSKSTTLFNKSLGLEGRRESAYKTKMKDMVRDEIEGPTNGLPLAVILLAKLMRTMAYSNWGTASEYIRKNHQGDPLKTIVSMGIYDLPDELKSCLLYMAGFPDRSKIEAGQLVRLWIAEGFLTQQLGVEPEELGQRYLKELIFRGLVKLEKKKEGDVELVTIRDQIHQFFRWEAQSTGFMETYYGGSSVVPDSARRLALNSRNLPKSDKMTVLKKLRTVLLSHDGQNNDAHCSGPQSFKDVFTHLLTNSTFLRVVSLEGIDIGDELPTEIRNMVHLQYLGVRCPTLTTVPDSIRKLKKLQIMDVRGTKVTTLPVSIWNIKSLRRVICDKDLGYRGAENLMLIITPATSPSGHIAMG